MSRRGEREHWLVRPRTIRGLWWGFSMILLLTVVAQLAIPVKGYFAVDGWFGFGAGYGFVSCLIMVLVAKVMGWLLKRPDDYYEESQGAGETVPEKVDHEL